MDEYGVRSLVDDVRGDMHRIQDELQRQIWDVEREARVWQAASESLQGRISVLESHLDNSIQAVNERLSELADYVRNLSNEEPQ